MGEDCALLLAGLDELGPRVLRDRFEQTVSGRDIGGRAHDQGLLRERLQQSEHLARIHGACAARHRLEVVQAYASGEDGEQPKQRLLVGAEQAVAPVQCRGHRPLSGGQVTGSVEGDVVQPCGQRGGIE